MEPDYGYAGDAACDDPKPLESIATIADEAERAATFIGAFITRFRHGNVPETASAGGQLKPVPSGHGGQIQRLRDAVANIDKLARDLNTLG